MNVCVIECVRDVVFYDGVVKFVYGLKRGGFVRVKYGAERLVIEIDC